MATHHHTIAITRRPPPRISSGAELTDALVASDRITDHRPAFRARLAGLDPLVCGCPRSGPPRPGCFMHDQSMLP